MDDEDVAVEDAAERQCNRYQIWHLFVLCDIEM